MKTSKKIALLLCGLLVATGLVYLKQGDPAKMPPKTPAPVPVIVSQAAQGEMPVLLDVVGRAEAYEGVSLKSRVDGQVLAVEYLEGQPVKQGEVLVRLDPADFQARVMQAEAMLARDQALHAKAQTDLDRYLGLKGRGFVSEEKVNEMRTNLAAAAATLKADSAALELARLQLAYTTIRAPFAGVVGARLVFPGSAVKTNDTVLAVVNRTHPLYVTFTVPERHLAALRIGMKGGGMPVQVSLPGVKSARYEAKARFIDNAVDSTTGAIQIKAVMDNRQAGLVPGQFVNVSLVLEKLEKAVLVPNEAVQQGADGQFLYVIKTDGTAEMRKIRVLASYREQSAIADGVNVGESVVVDGQLRLTPGASVLAKPLADPGVNAVGRQANQNPAPAR